MIQIQKPLLLIITVIPFHERIQREQDMIQKLTVAYYVIYACQQQSSFLRRLLTHPWFIPRFRTKKHSFQGVNLLSYYPPFPWNRIAHIHALNTMIFRWWLTTRIWMFRRSYKFFYVVVWMFHVQFYDFISRWHLDNLIIDTLDHSGDTSDSQGEFMKGYKTTGVLYNIRDKRSDSKALRVIPWGPTHEVRLSRIQRFLVRDFVGVSHIQRS